MLGITTTNARVGGFRGGISAEAKTIYNRIIADGGVSNLTRLNFFVKGLKTIYGSLTNVPVCYDAHWIGYKLGSGTGATAGQAAAKLYSLTVAGDAVQATAASQPLLLEHNGASSDNYWYGSGVTGNRVNSSAYTTNYTSIEFNTFLKCDSVTPAETNSIGAMGNDELFQLYTNTSTTYYLIFYWRNLAGVQKFAQSTAILMTNVNNKYIKITVENSGADQICKMYNSSDNITFTIIYQQTITTSTGFTNASKIPSVGAYATSAGIFQGKIYRMSFANSIGGAPVVDFNPATYNASTSQTAWTSSTGEIWTISTGTAASGYKGVLVDRTIVQGDGVNDYLDNPTFVRNNTMTQYLGFSSLATSGGGAQIIDASTANYYNSVYKDSSFVASYLNGAGPNVQSISSLNNTRYILAANYNAGVSNNLKLNNSIGAISTYSPTPSATGIRLFSKGGTVSSHNATITTYVYCINNDTTNNTTMFNFLKTLNNL